uniref:ATP synthase complex subunit 8 n=1 Tax=Stenocladius sp. FM17 TaxID=2596692 RepID=A0A5C0PWI2_9COLE|nr:ATP synthase F0 subunit 8 [Stenocladius sp. FM17]
MPQMAPMMWLVLMITFMITFLLMNSMNYFSMLYKYKNFKKYNKNTLKWKW